MFGGFALSFDGDMIDVGVGERVWRNFCIEGKISSNGNKKFL